MPRLIEYCKKELNKESSFESSFKATSISMGRVCAFSDLRVLIAVVNLVRYWTRSCGGADRRGMKVQQIRVGYHPHGHSVG